MVRKYEQRRRAEQQDETRQRIVDAAVELHDRVGPDRTTMSAVAELAGVQRNTLYRHFPDEKSLLHACSAHFVEQHPMPDTAGWAEIDEPVRRLRHGLGELYDHWEATESMTMNVLRDAEVNPLVREVSELRSGQSYAAIRTSLREAWPTKERTPQLDAALDLALGFRTWHSLVRGSGLTNAEAAGLMTRLVTCAADG